MDPKINDADKLEFFKNFSWETCVLNADQKKQHEEFSVEYHDVFAKHRLDVGYKTELKIKLLTEHPLPVYVQDPPAPIRLRDEILIEAALLHILTLLQRCHLPDTVVLYLFIANHLVN